MQNRISFLILIIFHCYLADAQQTCKCVSVTPRIGCPGTKIVAENCSGDGTDIQFRFGSFFQTEPTFTYSSSGTYIVYMQGNIGCGGVTYLQTATTSVLIKPTPAPVLNYLPCADKKVLILANDPQYDQYEVSLNDASITILKNQTGVWQLSGVLHEDLVVKGLYTEANCGGIGSLAVNSYDQLAKPTIKELVVVNENQIDLKFEAINYARYEIRQRIGNSTDTIVLDTIENKQGIQTFSVNNLSTSTKGYCFQVRAFDYCAKKQVFSDEFCTIVLSGASKNNANELSWEGISSFASSDYQLKIKESTTPISFANRPSTSQYTDTGLVCGKQYCYQIVGKYPSGIQTSSNEKCIVATSSDIPSTILELQSTIENNAILLSWPAQTANVYNIQFSSSKVFRNLGTSVSNAYSDTKNNPETASYCYQVNYTDACGNTSLSSPETCPVFLKGSVDSSDRQLNWQTYVGWAEGVREYVIEKIDLSGKTYFSQNLGLLLKYTDKGLDTTEQIMQYRIKAVSNTGRVTYSNTWKVEQKGRLLMPNAFSPNGDGLNDIFHADGLFIDEFILEIWNRNGEGVFSSTSFREGWDGKINGKPAPVDTYMYQVNALDKLGTTHKFSGTLQLIK